MTLSRSVWKKRKARVPVSVVGIDCGESALKAVHLRREGKAVALAGAAIRPRAEGQSPVTEEEIRGLLDGFHARGSLVRCAVSQGKLMIRYLDLPRMPSAQLPSAVRLNRKRYVPAQYSGYRIAVAATSRSEDGDEGDGDEDASMRVVLCGAGPDEVQSIRRAVEAAGYLPASLELAPLAAANAFEFSNPDAFDKEAFALADFGQGRSFVSLVHSGELQLTRQVDFGGETLTRELARRLGFDRDAAEELKLSPDAELDRILDPAVQGLCRELRSSLQYVELHGGIRLDRIHATGGCASSSSFLEALSRHLGVPIERWNPVTGLRNQSGATELNEMRLGAAIGAAIGGLVTCP